MFGRCPDTDSELSVRDGTTAKNLEKKKTACQSQDLIGDSKRMIHLNLNCCIYSSTTFSKGIHNNWNTLLQSQIQRAAAKSIILDFKHAVTLLEEKPSDTDSQKGTQLSEVLKSD